MPKPSLYDELNKYASKPGVLILIDSDVLSNVSTHGKRFFYDEEKNQLVIDGKNLNVKEESDLIKFLVENQDEGVDILDTEQDETIVDYVGYSDTYNPYKDSIELFTGKIPKKDLWALKMAFYMKIMNEKDEDIKDYRLQIRERFGPRGLYISNLCQSGYFEHSFRVAVLKLDSSKWREFYELRVGFELAALFVHNGMTRRALHQILTEKLAICSQMEVFKFKIHAMGGENIHLVKQFIESETVDFGTDVKITTVSESNNHPANIVVEIEIL